MCGCPRSNALRRPAVFSPCISRLREGGGCTGDLCAGFCFHFDLFMRRLGAELLQNVCSVPFGYIASSSYWFFAELVLHTLI